MLSFFNRYIRLFQESGLTKRWAQRLVTLTREYNRNNVEEINSDLTRSVEEGLDESDSVGHPNDSKKQKVLRIHDLQVGGWVGVV